jgi:hypothetical protein
MGLLLAGLATTENNSIASHKCGYHVISEAVGEVLFRDVVVA